MKKELNFEINILPILDILSVLICFLLLTAVWAQVGSLDTKQALGDNSVSAAVNPPSLWITMTANGTLKLSLKDLKPGTSAPALSRESQVSNISNQVDLRALNEKIQTLKSQLPELKTVVIMPEAQTNYGDVIKVMDQLKRQQLTDIGLSPLG